MPDRFAETKIGRELGDLLAACSEHMTDDEIWFSNVVGRQMADQMIYGFSAVDSSGRRVDPLTLQPWRSDA